MAPEQISPDDLKAQLELPALQLVTGKVSSVLRGHLCWGPRGLPRNGEAWEEAVRGPAWRGRTVEVSARSADAATGLPGLASFRTRCQPPSKDRRRGGSNTIKKPCPGSTVTRPEWLGPAAVRAFWGVGPPQPIQPWVPLKASSRCPRPASSCDPPRLGTADGSPHPASPPGSIPPFALLCRLQGGDRSREPS